MMFGSRSRMGWRSGLRAFLYAFLASLNLTDEYDTTELSVLLKQNVTAWRYSHEKMRGVW